MANIQIVKALPADKITKFTKPQIDQYIRANKENMKTIGLVGCITLLGALITVLDKMITNNHDEKMAVHEEKMLELEIEKMKITNDANNE